MQITKEDLYRVAHLARLEVSPKDEENMLLSLSEVLTWMDRLKQVNTEGVEPLTFMGEEKPSLREDIANNTLGKSDLLANAPQHNDSFVMVPKVVD